MRHVKASVLVTAFVVSAHAGRAWAGGELGAFDGHGDVGSPRVAGSATYNAVSQDYTLAAGGVNMWARRDEFHFVWKRLRGDFILQARLELLGQGADPHRKLGLIARSSLDEDAAYADAAVHGDGLTSLQFRRTRGADTERNLANKISRGGFTAAFFLQCLSAIGCLYSCRRLNA